MNLENKVAVVTGGSRGIGRAIALKLASMGADVAINYRSNEQEAIEVCNQIKEMGQNCVAYKCDVSDFSQSEEMINNVVSDLGRVDVLVNNAGITKDTLVMRMKEDDFDRVIDVNLKGTFNCSKHVSRIMMRQKSGRIINISSVVGVAGNAGQVNYSASKAGVIGVTKSMAKELATRGVTVNAVAPGYIQTDMTAVLDDKVKDKIKSSIPMQKLGDESDVANLVGFLTSEDAKYITGQVINVDGGMLM